MIQLTDIITEMGKHKTRYSYGIVAYLVNPFRILLAHPGGPFSSRKSVSHWSIPKGGASGAEDGWEAALREFKEETNIDVPKNIKEKDTINLGTITQRGGKVVRAWAIQMDDDDLSSFKSNTFLFGWPGHKPKEYPEIDDVEYFKYSDAAKHLRIDQFPLIQRLASDLHRKKHLREEELYGTETPIN